MKRICLIFALLIVSSGSYASESMMYGFAYDCNAKRINNILVSECTKNHPELSASMNAAMSTWLIRNKKNMKNCLNEILKIESEDERQKITLELEKLTELMVQHLIERAGDENPSFCKEAVSQLNDPKYDILK